MKSSDPLLNPVTFWWMLAMIPLLLVPAMFIGCETLGGGAVPRNTSEAILETKAIAKAYTFSITSLANRCVEGIPPECRKYAISRAQALEQLGHLEGVERDLRAALAVIEATGDPMAGGEPLARINSTLTLVLTFLASQEN